MIPTVCILTHCPNITYLYATLTTIQTIRIGFPTARVLVLENGSIPEARQHIMLAATAAEAEYLPLTGLWVPPIPHHEVLRGLLQDEPHILAPLTPSDGPLVVLDGDLLFWKSCEDWQVTGLLAGRLIPARVVSHAQILVGEQGQLLPRLHTSFWWIPDRTALQQRIMEIRRTHVTWDAFTPWMVPSPLDPLLWYVGDTACNLYGAFRADCTPFTTAQLDCYDHLFMGSTPGLIAHFSSNPFPGFEWVPRVHAAAQRGDWAAIRGVWREQEAYFTG
ncbi:MAG: hypothetical protein SGJ16_08765 [Nitrospirota bacterium]|nr:hypothetical protein [Nitrospirota bacterium]